MVGTTIATRLANLSTLVRMSTSAVATVSAATPSDTHCTWCRLKRRSSVCVMRLLPSASYPVTVGSWLRIRITAIPARKPVMTEKETKRVSRPNRNRPKMIWKTPERRTSRKSERSRSSSPTNACPATSAVALVLVMTMSVELASSPPTIGPIMLA